jgi:hypothetical protein
MPHELKKARVWGMSLAILFFLATLAATEEALARRRNQCPVVEEEAAMVVNDKDGEV